MEAGGAGPEVRSPVSHLCLRLGPVPVEGFPVRADVTTSGEMAVLRRSGPVSARAKGVIGPQAEGGEGRPGAQHPSRRRWLLCGRVRVRPTHPRLLAPPASRPRDFSLSEGAQPGAGRLHLVAVLTHPTASPGPGVRGCSQLPLLCLIANHLRSIPCGCFGCGELLGGQAAPGQPLTIARPPPPRLG